MRSRLTAWRTASDFLKAMPTKHAHMDSRVGETGSKQRLTREACHMREKQLKYSQTSGAKDRIASKLLSLNAPWLAW